MSYKPTSKRGAALLALAVLAAPAAARAQMKIAVINTEQILTESETGKKALADLKKLQEAKEGELKARQDEIKTLQTKAQEGRLSLAEDKLRELEKQLEDKVISARRLQDDATRELNKRRDEVLASIDAKVMPIINQLGAEGGYTVIFRKFESGLIFVDESVDITQQVIQRLDGAAAAAGK
jgi:Skp family chaperone for outer membrane proteins